MVGINRIKADFGRYICRSCINTEYGSHLTTKDCMYGIYPDKCVCCGEMRNIVIGFRLSGSLKMLLNQRRH